MLMNLFVFFLLFGALSLLMGLHRKDFVSLLRYVSKPSLKRRIRWANAEKSSFISNQLAEVRQILSIYNVPGGIWLLYAGSFGLALAGLGISQFVKNLFLAPILIPTFACVPFAAIKLFWLYKEKKMNDTLESALNSITSSYLRSSGSIIAAVEENIAQKNQEIEVAQQLVNTLRQEIATERATALQTRENEAVQQLADSLRQEIAANREATAQTRENTAIQQLAAALRQEFRKEQTESPRNQKDDAVQELVDSLREEIEDLQKNGIHLVSTNVFAVYPGKPEFTFSGEGFSLSSSAVTNREFVSYLTMTGTPDYSLAEEGLDNPVPRSFLDCVEYCNWLSRLYSLPEFYSVKNGAVQCNNNGGYRLPFEGELAEAASAGFSFPPEFAGLSLWSCTPSGTAGTLYRIETGTGEIRRSQTPAEDILACFVITRSKD